MVKCTFCGKEIDKGTGKIFVKDDGRIINFCSTKCEKNMFKLKRKPAKVRWTETFHKMRVMTAKKPETKTKKPTKSKK